MSVLLIVLLFIFLLIKVPIYVSIGLSSLVILLLTDVNLTLAIQQFFDGIDQFALMALPLFIFAAEIMVAGGISRKILSWTKSLVGQIPGGLAMTTQISSMLFGSLSGSSPATVVAIGRLMYPEMVKDGYDKKFSSALITSSASVALIIPPSITMIVYASVASVSVGQLFMAGIGAGLFYGFTYLVYVFIYAKRYKIQGVGRVSISQLWSETKNAIWALFMPVIILGGIYTGIFTPTEAAGVSVIYGIFVAMFVYKELNIKKLLKVSLESAQASAQILILIGTASLLGWLLTVLQISEQITNFFLNQDLSTWQFLLILNVIFLIAGMFIDASTAVIIIIPLVLSTANAFDVDLVHLGIIAVANLSIGMFTPPFGLNIFVSMGITQMSLFEMLPSLIKFLIISLIALIILTYFPQISMYIPHTLN